MSTLSVSSPIEGVQEPSLRVYLLGTPIIEWQGENINIPRRNVRCLLYRLGVALGERGGAVSREQLCVLFWPDSPDAVARRNLSHLLTHLRRALPDPELLQTLHGNVCLDPDRTWSDTAFCERACSRRSKSNPVEMEQASQYYRGPFLHGCSLPKGLEFDAWVTKSRNFYERQYLELLSALIDIYRQKGEYAAAITSARRYLETDELAEAIHRKLIELYMTAGDSKAARRQLEACITVLERELGVSPMPETWAACQPVVQSRPIITPHPRMSAQMAALAQGLPFVSREKELDLLKGQLDRASAGQSVFVLICGEPGIGKSRLMDLFASLCRGRALVLESICSPGARTLPYLPLAEAMRGVLKSIRSLPVDTAWLAEASRLLPELRDLMPQLPPPLPGEAEDARTRLFEALCFIIQGLSSPEAPVVLFLDDLQWADTTTLEWLGYLGDWLVGGKRGAVLVVGSYREPVESTAALSTLRNELARLGLFSELHLDCLAVVDIHGALQHLMEPFDPDEALAERLHRVSGGNPFFLTEILRGFIETSGRYPESPEDLDALILPNTVRETIRQRLSGLSPLVRQILETAAVLETVSSLDVLRHTSGRNELEALESLEKLVDNHLLDEREGVYRFHHELIRNTLNTDLSQWRGQLLHRRAAEALEMYQPENVVALAWHFEQAGRTAKAAECARQAGLNAGAVFAYPEAIAYYDRALALLRQAAEELQDAQQVTDNRYQQVEVLSERSWLFRLLGKFEACRQDLQGQSRLAKSLEDPRILADVCASEAYIHRRLGHLDKALRSARASLRLGQQVYDPYLEARAYREIGVTLRAQGDFEPARNALDGARKRFAEIKNDILLIHTLGNLATLCENTGEYEQALEYARQALEICEQAGLPYRCRLPLGDMGVAFAMLGDDHQGRDCLLQSLSLARQVGDRAQEIFCLDRLGWLAMRLNQPAKALDDLRAGLALAEQIESRLDQSHIHSGLAEAYRLSGDPKLAETHALRAVELAEEVGQAYELEIARGVLAQISESNL